jgi:hypothetical protein
MKVRMLTHYMRAADHINVIRYLGGEKYDLPDEEARLFIAIGVAVEDKDMGGAPETKGGTWISEPDNNLAYFQPDPEPENKSPKRRKR